MKTFSCFVFVVLYAAFSALFAVGLQFSVNFWSHYFGATKELPYFAAFVVSLFPGVGQIIAILSLITYILSFIL